MADGNILDILSHPAAADPSVYTKGIEGLNALRDQQAKQAISQIYQRPDVVNPQTGEVDQGRLNVLLSQSPQAAWNAAGAMQAQGQAATSQGQGVQEQLTAHRSRMAFMLGQMNDMLAKGQPIGAGDIATALNNAHFSPAEAAQVTQAINRASGGDPNFDYTGFVKNQVTANLSAQEQIDRITPKITFVATPQGVVAQDTNPNTTKTGPGTAIPYGLSPGTKYWDPKGGPDGTGAWVLSGGIVAPGTTTPPGGGGNVDDPIASLPKNQALAAIVQRESGGKNVPTAILGADGKPASTATGYYQMLDSTWQEAAALAGIKNPPPRAMDASRADQDAAASALYDKYGTAPWAKSGATPPRAPAVSTAPPAPPAPPQSTATVGRPGGPGTYLGPGMGVLPAAPAPALPPVPVARTSPTLRSDIQGGVPVASANPLQVPTVGAPGPPSPLVPGYVNAIMQGRANARATPASGVQTAFNALQSGGVGPVAAPPPAPASPAQPVAAAPPPSPVRPPVTPASGQLMAEPPLGTKETIEGRATASVNMANAMHAQASQSPQRQALLADMEATNKQINTNPAAEAEARWGAFVNSLPENISSLIPGMSRAQVAGSEGFAKLSETFRQMQAGGIAGTLTNDKFASALASNPHLALSTLGNAGMIHLLQGSEDALQYKDRSWIAASGANPSLDYQSWETNFNKSFDPRVFWWSRMERSEQQRLMGGMGDQQKQTLLDHLIKAEADGLVSRPGRPGG